MEIIAGFVIGLLIGLLVAWLAMKLRASGNVSRLEAEAKLMKQSIEEIEQANSKLQQESSDWQNQAIDNRTEVAGLQSQLLSANQNIEDARRTNRELNAKVQDWQSTANENANKIAELQAQLDAANKRLEDATRTNRELNAKVQDWQSTANENANKVAELQAQLDAANKRLEDATRTNQELNAKVQDWQSTANENANKVAELQAQLDAADKRLTEQTDIEKTLLDQFKVMASDVVANNNETFLATADEKIGTLVKQAKTDFDFSKEAVRDLVKPLSDELKRIEEARNTSQGSLKQQIETLVSSNKTLEDETKNLSTALKRPEGRGRWGEVQLRRVVELAGMIEHCDFDEQVSVTSEDGNRERPDMVVHMPNERTIVIDSKTPLRGYLSAIESQTEDERDSAMTEHAEQVRDRVRELAKKSYPRLFNRSPEFVVMFLPGEFFLQPALEKYPDLMEESMEQKVVIATPSTLIALLKTVEMGWQEAKLAEEASKIGDLGRELHDRLYTFADNMGKVRHSLNQTVHRFNSSIGSLEGRVLPSARKFKELGVQSSKEINIIEPIDTSLRQLRSVPTDDKPITNHQKPITTIKEKIN